MFIVKTRKCTGRRPITVMIFDFSRYNYVKSKSSRMNCNLLADCFPYFLFSKQLLTQFESCRIHEYFRSFSFSSLYGGTEGASARHLAVGSCMIAPLALGRSLNFKSVSYLGQKVSHVFNSKTCAWWTIWIYSLQVNFSKVSPNLKFWSSY